MCPILQDMYYNGVKIMNRHAYLIMAFNHFDLLKKLLHLLDDERNDIFVHIDAKADDFDVTYFDNAVRKSKIIFIPRTKVYWADYSQTNAELCLLHEACNKDHYKYYHLISGSDLPIKTQNQIHEFLDDKDNEFLGIFPEEIWYSVRRVKFYHPFTHNKFYRTHKELKVLDLLLEYVQKFVSVNRLKNKEIKIIDGWNWFTITDDFARYVLSKRDFIEDTFQKTIASDELIMQTMLYNSDFYKKVYNIETKTKGCLRYIDWSGKPSIFRTEDFDRLINAEEAIFARKFDPDVDSEIIEKISIPI